MASRRSLQVLLAVSAAVVHAQPVELGINALARPDAVHVASRDNQAMVVWNTLPTTAFSLFSASLQPDGGVAMNTIPMLGNFTAEAPRVTAATTPGSWFVAWTDFSSTNVPGGALLFDDGGTPQVGGGFPIGATHPTNVRLTSTPTGYRVHINTGVSTDVSVFGTVFVSQTDVPRPQVGSPFDLVGTASGCVWAWVADGGVGLLRESWDGGGASVSSLGGATRTVSLARRGESVVLAREQVLSDGGSLMVWSTLEDPVGPRQLEDARQPSVGCSGSVCWLAFVRQGSVFAMRDDGTQLQPVYDGLAPSVAVLSDGRAWVAGSTIALSNRPWVALVGEVVDAGAALDAGTDAGVDAGATFDAGVDAGATFDAGAEDAGVDAGVHTVDAGAEDAGVDAGVHTVDAGAEDAGLDAGVHTVDAGAEDAGLDAGAASDAGADAGVEDAGVLDREARRGRSLLVGCGCGAVDGPWALLLLLLAWARRRA